MSSFDDIRHWVINYFVDETMTSPEFMGDNTRLDIELGRSDYVDRVLLVVAIESEYDIVIHDNERDSWETIGDIVKTIFKKERKLC